MKTSVVVALIAGFPPTLAAILGYLANSRSLRRAVGEPAIPLSAVVDRLEVKLDHVDRNVTGVGERFARLEGAGDSARAEHRFQSLFRELRSDRTAHPSRTAQAAPSAMGRGKPVSEAERLWTVEELARFLGVPASTSGAIADRARRASAWEDTSVSAGPTSSDGSPSA